MHQHTSAYVASGTPVWSEKKRFCIHVFPDSRGVCWFLSISLSYLFVDKITWKINYQVSVTLSGSSDNGLRNWWLRFSDVLDSGGTLTFDPPKVEARGLWSSSNLICNLVFLLPILFMGSGSRNVLKSYFSLVCALWVLFFYVLFKLQTFPGCSESLRREDVIHVVQDL